MKKEYEKVEVSSKEEYEKLYFKCQGRCDNCLLYTSPSPRDSTSSAVAYSA